MGREKGGSAETKTLLPSFCPWKPLKSNSVLSFSLDDNRVDHQEVLFLHFFLWSNLLFTSSGQQ